MFRDWLAKFHAYRKGHEALEEELRSELEAHMQLQIEDAVENGESPEAARRRFGNSTIIHESAAREWRFNAMDTFVRDLKYSIRGLRHNWVFNATVILLLTIGIGANTAVFSVVDALLFKPLPVHRPDQLVVFKHIEPIGPVYPFPHRWLQRFEQQAGPFAQVAGSWMIDRYNVQLGGVPSQERVALTLVSGRYFQMLGVNPQVGRLLSPDDDLHLGAHPVAVVSYAFWSRRFGQSADWSRQTLTLNGTTFTVVGVAPQGFSGAWAGRPSDMWVPYSMAIEAMPELQGSARRLSTIILARLKPNVARLKAQAAAQVMFQQSEESGSKAPQATQVPRIELEAGEAGYAEFRRSLELPLMIISLVVAIVFLIACANLVALSLARAQGRNHEMTVRLALGAARSRLVQQLAVEAAVVTGLGTVACLLLAFALSKALSTLLGEGTVRAATLSISVDPNLRVLGFTLLLSLVTAVVLTLAPARQSARITLSGGLSGRGTGKMGSLLPGKIMVILQVALTIVLLVAAGLCLRSLRNLHIQDAGFAKDDVTLVWIAPVQTGRGTAELWALLDSVRHQLQAIPGVRSVGLSNGGVLEGGEDTGGPSEQTLFDGGEAKPGMTLRFFAADHHFLESAGMRLIAGRWLADSDTDQSASVAVINQSMARFFWGTENPVGRRFGGPNGRQTEVVGVVNDTRAGSARDQRGVWYLPYRQNARALSLPAWCFVIRASHVGDLAGRIREEVRRADSSLPLLRINTVDQQLIDVLAQDRLLATVATGFGAIALVIAAAGVFGVVSHNTRRRTAEIGVRMALGATQRRILAMVIGESLTLISIGVAIGLPLSFLVSQLVRSRLFGVSTFDLPSVLASCGILLGVGAAAALVPAIQSSRTESANALRAHS